MCHPKKTPPEYFCWCMILGTTSRRTNWAIHAKFLYLA